MSPPDGRIAASAIKTLITDALAAAGLPHADAALCAEEVRDDGVGAALHALEEERRAAPLDDAAVDFGEFEAGVNFGLYVDEVALAP